VSPAVLHAAPGDAVIPEDVLNEAAIWLMELHEGPLNARQRAQLAAWRQRSPEHERAWDKATALLEKFGALPPSGTMALKKMAMPERRSAAKMLALMLATGPAAWLAWRSAPWPQHVGAYSTAAGERRDIILADGTQLSLNTDTAIDVEFDQARRVVHLRRGEILITTAKDNMPAPRPFLVTVAEGRIRALGTRFTVRQLEETSRVAVFDGAVEVSPRGAPSAVSIIPAGKQSAFSATRIAPLAPADENSTAWQNGMLIADRMPMSQFIKELSRYRRGTLQCDPAIARLQVSGVFPLADTGFTLSLIEQTMPVRMQYFTRYWVSVVPA
jgi:transmembrane sensor